MRINNVILVTTGAIETHGAKVVDQAIRRVLELKKNPILVLGPDGDDVLRECTLLDSCDLAYDDAFKGADFSGIRAGLYATAGAAFVLPLRHGLSNDALWSRLESELPHDPQLPFDVLRAVTEHEHQALYPCVVTSRGVSALRELPADSDWNSLDGIVTRLVNIDLPQSSTAD